MTRSTRRRRLRCYAAALVLPAALVSAGLASTESLHAEAAEITDVRASPQDGLDYQQPSLATDPQRSGHLAIAFQEGGHVRGACWLSLSSDGGRTWMPRPLVGAGAVLAIPDGFTACWNPSVAYGPDGTLYYLMQSSASPGDPYSHVLLMASRDGGSAFAAPVPVDSAVVARGIRAGGDWWPAMAVDHATGAVYVTWSSFTPLIDTSRAQFATSSDGGRTFSPPTTLSTPDQQDVTGSVLAVGRGGALDSAWVDYSQFERGYVVECADLCNAARTGLYTDQQIIRFVSEHFAELGSRIDFAQGIGCESFYEPNPATPLVDFVYSRGGICDGNALISTAHQSGGGAVTTSPPVGAGAALGCAGRRNPWVNHSCDPLHPSFFDHNLLSLAAGSRPGRAYLVWWDNGDALTEAPARVRLAISSDSGTTWAVTPQIGIPDGRQVDAQHRPSVSVSPIGRVDIAYYDRSPDGSQRVFVTSASENDMRFTTPVQIASAPSNTRIGPLADDGWPSFGDHLAVASTAHDVMAAWTDTRSSSHQTVYFARTSVTVPSHSGGGGGTPVGPIATAAVGAALLLGLGTIFLVKRMSRRRGRDPAAA